MNSWGAGKILSVERMEVREARENRGERVSMRTLETKGM